ncbi:MAG: hypothetical protein KKD28_00115 [Chloroflexi bacterium]|nr:hypothetical protein [Chloroflexota bacterium]
MFTVEFHAAVRNGLIEIPDEYKEHIMSRVRVTLLQEEYPEVAHGFIGQLLENPLKIDGFQPLTREEMYVRQTG